FSISGGRYRSQATASHNQSTRVAPLASAALSTIVLSSAASAGSDTRVATSDMKPSDRVRKGRPLKDAVLIAGPTASGKSALALDVARRTGGVVVNADSMQVYSVLSALTARPGPEETRAVPHELYGHVHPSESYSTGHWLRDVERLIEKGTFQARMPIFVGGPGLYFRASTEGLAPIPGIPSAIRAQWRHRLEREGAEALHERLARDDPAAAQQIRPSDGQRIVRALEVLEA